MLQAANDDSGSDTDLRCELLNAVYRKPCRLSDKILIKVFTEKKGRGELVGLVFLGGVAAIYFVHIGVLSAMLEDVCGLMKKGEPKVVIALVAKRQCNDYKAYTLHNYSYCLMAVSGFSRVRCVRTGPGGVGFYCFVNSFHDFYGFGRGDDDFCVWPL